MSEPKWTPGPWRWNQNANFGNLIQGQTKRRSHQGDEGWRTVATFQDACDSELYVEQEANRVANARLIAAAPELYDALIEAREAVDEMLRDQIRSYTYRAGATRDIQRAAVRPDDMGDIASLEATIAKIAAALAKARGETP